MHQCHCSAEPLHHDHLIHPNPSKSNRPSPTFNNHDKAYTHKAFNPKYNKQSKQLHAYTLFCTVLHLQIQIVSSLE